MGATKREPRRNRTGSALTGVVDQRDNPIAAKELKRYIVIDLDAPENGGAGGWLENAIRDEEGRLMDHGT